MPLLPYFRRYLTHMFICGYAVLALYTMAVFMVGGEFGGVGERSVQAMVNGNAVRPNVYRVLVPSIVRVVVAATPQGLEDSATATLAEWRDSNLMRSVIKARYDQPPPSLNDKQLYAVGVAHAVVFGFLCGYLYFLYQLASHTMPESRAYALMAPVLALLLIPSLSYKFAYIYDYAALMLFTAALYHLAKREWPEYLLYFTLATINKETSMHLLFFSIVYGFGRVNKDMLIKLVFAQLGIFIVLKAAVSAHYAGNAGIGFTSTFYMMLRFFFAGYSHLTFLGMVVTFLLLTYRWKEKPEFLRYGLWLFPVLGAAHLFYGWPAEFRHFYELTPLALLLATHTIVKWSGFDTLELFAPLQKRKQAA